MSEYPPVSEIINECLRCHHKWITRVTNPKRCPKCKSPYWNKQRVIIENVDLTKGGKIYLGNEPKGEVHKSNYDIKRLEAQIVSLHEEVADRDHIITGKNLMIEKLNSERLPKPLDIINAINPQVYLPARLYNQLKSHLLQAMRDKVPKIAFELKGNEILEIL